MTSLASQLQAASDSLTPANWRKGALFSKEDNILCMCAHGAVQAQVNPLVKLAIDNLDSNDFINIVYEANGVLASGASRRGVFNGEIKSVKEFWLNRDLWIRANRIRSDINTGNGDAHFLLGMVGLTESFNDAASTTFEMVQQKFKEAIALAKELGE